jgi:hypothetical protein
MQWHALIGSPDPDNFTGSRWPGGNPSLGAMGPATLDALSEVISAHTRDTPNCFFGLCTIQTWEEQFSAEELRQPYLELPDGRDHIVLAGPLSAARRIVRDWGKQTAAVFTFGNGAKVDPSEWRLREAPNLIWPADHSWLVASEVDFDSTLVGGSNELIEAIVGSPTLEAWQVEPADSLAADADKINRPGSRDG